MGRPPALLALLALLAAASEQHPRPFNATSHVPEAAWKGGSSQQQQQATGSREAAGGEEHPAPQRNVPGAKESHRPPPAALPGGGEVAAAGDPAGGSPPGTGISVRYFSGESGPETNQTEVTLCLGCPGGRGQPQDPLLGDLRGPMEALSSITSFALPVQEQDGAQKLSERRELPGGASPLPGSQEEAGSGDQHATAPPSEGTVPKGPEWTAAPTALQFATETSSPAGQDFSYDADEREILLDTGGGVAVLPSPTLSGPVQAAEEGVAGQDSAQKEEPLELWVDSASSSPAKDAQGHLDLAWLNTEAPRLAATPPVQDVQTPKPSPDPSASEIIGTGYLLTPLCLADSRWETDAGCTKRKPSDDKGMSWSLHDLYDDFTPFDESDFYPTTSFYIDGEEEDLDEPEDDEEEEDGGGGLARDLEDENDYRIPTPGMPKIQTAVREVESTSRRYVVPPLQTFVAHGGLGAATPRPRPAESGKDQSLSGGGENGTDCRSGYVRHNNSCKSVCDIFPSYCHNGGQCYMVENLGAFCR
uniref:Uncharacterized protein n=1 Tax=Sphaerodactylus townsendi TaxID=933632 RepID=A0ACB8FVV1_9SAUR